jgi:hypothetical protein
MQWRIPGKKEKRGKTLISPRNRNACHSVSNFKASRRKTHKIK